jgi:hypothetical protein
MKLFVATFRYYYDGDTEIYLATTIAKAQELLTERMQSYLQDLQDWDADKAEIPSDYKALQEIGWDQECYNTDIELHPVHSDEHILKHVMEKI